MLKHSFMFGFLFDVAWIKQLSRLMINVNLFSENSSKYLDLVFPMPFALQNINLVKIKEKNK
jgi:hypothetical protein